MRRQVSLIGRQLAKTYMRRQVSLIGRQLAKTLLAIMHEKASIIII